MDVRDDGRWEEWVRFFLRGIIEISSEASESAKRIDALRETTATKVNGLDAQMAVNARRLLDQLFITPRVTRNNVGKYLGVSAPTAGALVRRFCDELGILVDSTPEKARNKQYVFKDYMDILEVGTN